MIDEKREGRPDGENVTDRDSPIGSGIGSPRPGEALGRAVEMEVTPTMLFWSLQAINDKSVKTKTRVENLEHDMREVKGNVAGLKTDVAGLKTDVAGLKTDVAGLKTDVSGLKADVRTLGDRVTVLSTDVAGLKTDVTGLKTDVRTLGDRVTDLTVEMHKGLRFNLVSTLAGLGFLIGALALGGTAKAWLFDPAPQAEAHSTEVESPPR